MGSKIYEENKSHFSKTNKFLPLWKYNLDVGKWLWSIQCFRLCFVLIHPCFINITYKMYLLMWHIEDAIQRHSSLYLRPCLYLPSHNTTEKNHKIINPKSMRKIFLMNSQLSNLVVFYRKISNFFFIQKFLVELKKKNISAKVALKILFPIFDLSAILSLNLNNNR